MDRLLSEIAAENGWQIVARELMPDRVCVFIRVRLTDSFAEVVRRRVPWPKSYFAASVGYVFEPTVRRYQWDAA